MLIGIARWLLCVVAIAAVIVESINDVDHPVVWITLVCVFLALRIISRDREST